MHDPEAPTETSALGILYAVGLTLIMAIVGPLLQLTGLGPKWSPVPRAEQKAEAEAEAQRGR